MAGRSINKVWIGKGRSKQSFNVINVKANHPTRVAKHPVETGNVIMDNKVIDPIEIEVSIILILSDDNFPSQRAFLNAARNDTSGELYTVCTKYDSYLNMIVESIDDDEGNDKYDATVINVKFVQQMSVEAKGSRAESPDNTNESVSGIMNAQQNVNKMPDILMSQMRLR